MASNSSTNNIITLTEEDVPRAKLKRRPEESSVMELERWLECHGGKKKGLEAELIKRVCGLMEINKKVDLKVDGGKWYETKPMKKPSIDDIQNLLSITEEQNEGPTILDGWGNFPSQTLPSMFNHGNIYHYLVELLSSIELEHDNMGDEIGVEAAAIPFRKGRQLLDSGFVEDIQEAMDDES